MGRFTRHGMDEQPLEGGGRGGGGYKSLSTKKQREPDDVALDFLAGGAGLASAAGAASMAMRPKMTDEDYRKASQDKREAAAEIKRESRGKEDSMTSGQKQSMQEAQDAKTQAKKDKAYNAAKTYPDDYAKGGMTASSRADGIAQRGKTRGKII